MMSGDENIPTVESGKALDGRDVDRREPGREKRDKRRGHTADHEERHRDAGAWSLRRARSRGRWRVIDRFREWAFDRRGRDHNRRVYDWWSRHDQVYSLFVDAFLLGRTGAFRDRTVDACSLDHGDSVLDIGCGPGPNFGALAAAVGPEGRIVGVDTSPRMVARAGERGARLAPETAVLRADATRLPVRDERFDAACATLSLSAMPDVRAVVDGVHDALRPGGRFAVLDTRSFQSGPLCLFNPLVEGVAAALTNWYPDAPVVESIAATFAEISVETFQGGTVYVATGHKAA